MKLSFQVDKVMCGGCTSNIEKNLNKNDAITAVTVNVETGQVDITATDDVTAWAKAKCEEIGFPEKAAKTAKTVDPLAAFKAGALGK